MKQNRIYNLSQLPDFDWRKYLELNPDLKLILEKEEDCAYHYTKYGQKEGRLYK